MDRIRADAALLRRAADGESAAWREIVDAHAQPLFGYAWRLLGERDAAEDVVQETLVRLWGAAPGWRPEAPVRAWLYRVAGNLARDALRRRRDVVELGPNETDPAPTVEEQVADSMEVALLRRLVAELPERQRTALLLCRIEGLSMREAGHAMSCSEESIEALLGRARRTLRTRMAEFGMENRRTA